MLPILLLLQITLLTPVLTSIVIVGAGTSGCTLASNLCRRLPETHITLLERAPPRDPLTNFHVRAPRMMWRAWLNPRSTELFPSLQSPGIFQPINIITGSTLGGSSAMNGMQWSVPVNGTIQKWGIRGLRPKVARRFYRRAFRRARPGVRKRFLQTYVDQYMNAALKAGFRDAGPFRLGDEDAIWKNLLVVDKKGRRRDSCTIYLKKALKKCPKLKLIQGATVTKVMLRRAGYGLKAVGVRYLRHGRVKTLRGRDVILSAGPYGSPKLLQQSGIGPRGVLKRAGVRVKRVLPVGKRTIARPATVVISAYTGVPLDPTNNGTIVNSTMSRMQWESGRGGVLAVGAYAFNGRLKDGDGYFATSMALGPNLGLDSPQIWSICLTNAVSEGFVRIVSKDPMAKMKVQLNLLGGRGDLGRMRRCIKRMQDIHDQLPKEFGVVNIIPLGSSEREVREVSVFAFHFVGGCRVGDVVDSELKVLGIRRLKVVDASVFNALPVSAGPMASVYMLAEFMADKIAKDRM